MAHEADTPSRLVEALARICARHGGDWQVTHEAFADRLSDAFVDAGEALPPAGDAFRFFARALTPAGLASTLADGRRLTLRVIPCAVPGAPDEIISVTLEPCEAAS